jgi:hypothetical protein
MVSINRVSALALRSAGLKFGLLAFALVTLLLQVAASAQQTFTGGGAIAVGRTQTTASSSTLTIASPTGSSIATLKVVLNGVTSDGSNCADGNCWSMEPTSFMLTSPTGEKLVLLGFTGDSIDGDDNEDSGSGLSNVAITIADTGNAAPNGTPWQHTGSVTVKPSSYYVANGQTPPLGAAGNWPQSDGSATLTNTFADSGISNGDQWTLTVQNMEGYTTPINVSSWELVVTYASTTPTSTSVSSSQNPAFTTSPNNSVTLTADVTPNSGPIGTVAFTDNGTIISGCGAALVSSGHATCTTTALPQGYNAIEAAYGGGGGYGQSNGSLTELIEVHPTQSGNTWCNNTSFSAPLNGTPIAYPAVIPVSGYSAGTTVGNVTLELEGVTQTSELLAEFLLVAPGGNNNLDFLDSAFHGTGSGLNLYISDSASVTPNYGTPVSGGTYIPWDGNTQSFDEFPASNSPIVDSNIPSVPGTINYAATYGKTNALTLQQAFSGAPANGDWALYATASNGSDALTVGGWCVTLDLNSGIGTTTAVSSSSQKAAHGSNVTLSATVTAGGSPVTSGTVEFKDETTGTVLASANSLNGSGVASVTVSNLAEGDHKILASYSGNGSFNTSFGNMYQRIDDTTAVTAVNSNTWQFCNTGAITLPEGSSGAETPNPSNIFVANLPGTLNKATLTLNNFSILVGDQLDNTESLVVGPTGAGLDFFSNTADGTIEDEALAGTYTFADSASALVPSGSGNLNPGTYKPTSYVGTDNGTDVFTADPGGFFTLPGTFGYSASRGSSTFASEFSGTNPVGTWSLYFNSPNANANGTGAAGGWCVDLTENLPTVSVTKAHGGDFQQGESNAAFTVVIDNIGTNGPTGDPTGTNPMTVTDTLNSALTYSTFSGTNWSCSAAGQVVTCTNDSAIAQGSSYPTLTINVNVASNAPRTVTNSVTVSGAGVASTNSNTDSVTVDTPPTITSANNTTFTVGSAGTFTVTTTGFPTPSITENGALPSGVTFTDNGNGTATLSGTPAAGTGGSYPFTITASNTASPNANQSFTLTVDQAPAITSASSTTFTSGSSINFTVTTTGYPTPTLSESGALPGNVTFTNNGNGTATISGTASVAGSYGITINAGNGVSPTAGQSFTLNVNPGAATHYVIPGEAVPFNTTFGFTITAEDAAGNVATSYNGTAALSSSDPGFSNLGPVTFVNGSATPSAALKTAGVQSITATDISNPSITGTGFFTVSPGPASQIVLTAPSSANVGTPISLTVTAYDFYGNVATSYGGTVTFTSSDPHAILPAATPITNGTGTVSATLVTTGNQTITATDSTNAFVAHSGNISVTISNLVVTTAADDAGSASNCTVQTTPGTGTDASCSLRDALLFAANAGSANISFDSRVFASPSTITLSNGTLTLPVYTYVTGPTSGSGPTLTNLVTVNGGGVTNNSAVFTVNGQSATESIANLIITNGFPEAANSAGGIAVGYGSALTVTNSTITANTAQSGTGGIFNDYNATLTLIGSTISNNFGAGGGIVNESGGTVTISNSTITSNTAKNSAGGGIENAGTVTVSNSTFSFNSSSNSGGGGIYNGGTLTVAGSTFSGNQTSTGGGGGGIEDFGTLTVTNSTFSGNLSNGSYGGGIFSEGNPTISGSTFSGNAANLGGGIYFSGGSITVTNSILSSDSGGSVGECYGTGCPTDGTNGNVIGGTGVLSPLGNYGGPTQTMVPLPGSEALCGGTLANATTNNLTTDQRGFPFDPVCPSGTVDSGAVQSNYAIAFTTQPPSSNYVGSPLSPAPVVTLTESGVVFTPAAGNVTIVDADGGLSLSGTNSEALSAGTATFSNLIFSQAETGDTLTASLVLNPNLTPALIITSQPSTGITAVVTPATMISPTPGLGTVLPSTNVTFQWTTGGGVTEYQLNLGTTGPGASDLATYKGTNTTTTLSNMPANGVTVYARLLSYINGTWQFNDYVYTESPTPVPAALTNPTPGLSTILGASNVSFQWTAGTGVTLYQLNLGTIAPGSHDLYLYKGSATSTTAPTLPATGQIVYARLYSLINDQWVYNDYQYTESGSTSAGVLTSPTPGLATALGTRNVTFQWTTGTGVDLYELSLGTVPGASDLFEYKGSATSVNVPSLPADGQIVYARLYSRINGTWIYNDYVYYNNYYFGEGGNPVPATLTSPTPGLGTVLGTSNVPFQWTTGTGVTLYQLNLSTVTPGASDLFQYKGAATTATASSLPSNGATVYARLFSYINGAWQHNDYVYTESGTAAPAVLTSPTPGLGTTLGTTNVQFQWTAGTSVTEYQLNLSAVAAGESELFIFKGTTTTATAPTLPANGVTVYARLYSKINGVWQYNDYVYTEFSYGP